ncbi:hypothetical protein CCMSSC00406_0006180 [Pleurotus cornucopiae]|uniref:Uncharacterized protein n=1 Tax=Pleurotus cornucopiae TaxID=5321 RepID=A0ACB7J8S9_PLECO|nr:hypothetical protein CCMSSC00406_0006180 [Pleurotus cornucopiae]
MRFASAAIAFSATALVAAQNVVVQVGSVATADGGVFQFIPNDITAANGTTVTFRFTGAPGNHTVTQSSFADPCNPLAGGFDSGFVFIPPTNTSETPEWTLTVTDDSRPIWFYCKQLIPSPHCGAGMVGAINAPSTGNTLANFVSAARAFSGASGQGQGGLSGVGATASAAPSPIAGGASLVGAPTSGAPAPTSSGSPTGSDTNTSPSSTGTGNSASALGASSWLLGLGAVMGVIVA